eukprot:7614051-Alexandrium_andersonii.AAC.1
MATARADEVGGAPGLPRARASMQRTLAVGLAPMEGRFLVDLQYEELPAAARGQAAAFARADADVHGLAVASVLEAACFTEPVPPSLLAGAGGPEKAAH